ncbi:MAG: hypothetical protein KKF44_05980 [Nanoarchaeota archaeon]|nr:hypothetical protein [Nanoarchaeota archaeon]
MKENELKLLTLLIIVNVLLLISPHILRYKENPYLMGSSSYFHIWVSKNIEGNVFSPIEDTLFFGGREIEVSISEIILSFFTNKEMVMKILPFVLGILSTLIFYLILRRLKVPKIKSFFTCLILILSPIYINTFSIYNNFFIAVFLVLLSSFFLLKENYFFAFLMFILIVFIHLNSIFIILIMLLIFYYKTKEKNSMLYFILAALFFAFAVIVGTLTKEVGFSPLLQNIISDFGADIGFGIFSLLLSSIGILLSWKRKKENLLLYLMLLTFAILTIYSIEFIIYLEYFMVYFAGIAFVKLLDYKWQLVAIKQYAILLILCGLFFSSGSYINRLVHLQPTPEEVLSLEWLSKNSAEYEVVLTQYKNGNLIVSLAGRPVISDEYYFISSKEKIRIEDSNRIFYSRILKDTKELLDKYSIRYIWINPQMKKEIWKKDEEGLLFLLDNSNSFKKIYDFKGIEIWKYTE